MSDYVRHLETGKIARITGTVDAVADLVDAKLAARLAKNGIDLPVRLLRVEEANVAEQAQIRNAQYEAELAVRAQEWLAKMQAMTLADAVDYLRKEDAEAQQQAYDE